jgi:hypothetical protein
MAKAKSNPLARQMGESVLRHTARLARERQNERDKKQPIVTAETYSHGKYVSEGATIINKNATPFTKWRALNSFTETQEAGIYYCLRLWEAMPPAARTTGSYGERIGGGGNTFEADEHVNRYLDAKDAIIRIESYFKGELKGYWQVFENAIRFDIPSGVAGNHLDYVGRSGNAKCLAAVQYVATTVAEYEGLAINRRILAA